jgi:dynein heavy chain 2
VTAPVEKAGNESPITSFILLERYNAIKLVQSVHQSLASLSKVIRGTQLLSKDVQDLAAALLNQSVSFIIVLDLFCLLLCYFLSRLS